MNLGICISKPCENKIIFISSGQKVGPYATNSTQGDNNTNVFANIATHPSNIAYKQCACTSCVLAHHKHFRTFPYRPATQPATPKDQGKWTETLCDLLCSRREFHYLRWKYFRLILQLSLRIPCSINILPPDPLSGNSHKSTFKRKQNRI